LEVSAIKPHYHPTITMGVQGAKAVLHQIKGLTLDHLEAASRVHAELRGEDLPITAVIDASWNGMRSGHRDAVEYMVDTLRALIGKAYQIFLVFDPETRCHTKVASIERKGKRECARAMAYRSKTETMRITTELRTERLTEAERQAKLAAQKKLQSAIQAAENLGKKLLPHDFEERLREEVEKLEGNVVCFTGSFQADSMISKLVENNEVDLIFASDADYSFVNGPKCLQVTEFKLKNNGKVLSDVVVKSGFYDSLHAVVAASGDLDVENIDQAEYPLIDGQEDLRYCLAVGLALGCDVLVGGISGLGLEKLNHIIKSAQAECGVLLTADNLLEALSKWTGCDLSFQELKVLLDAWYFEPAAVTESGEFHYVFHAPAGPVDEYCAAFAEKSEPGIQLIECHGHVGQHPHKYLRTLVVSCSDCESLCCGFCCVGYSPSKRINKYQKWTCLRCHASEIPADDVTTEKMREEILAAGLRVPQEATVAELQGLYEEAIENQAFHVPHDITYPLLQSKCLTDGTLEYITTFNFENGGRMVHDPLLKADLLVELTALLSKMVTFSDLYVRDDMSSAHQKATEALPDIVNKFCEGSRADHGERLKKMGLEACS